MNPEIIELIKIGAMFLVLFGGLPTCITLLVDVIGYGIDL